MFQDHKEVDVGCAEVVLWSALDPTEVDLEGQVLVGVENIEVLWIVLNIRWVNMKSQVLTEVAL